MIFPSGLLRITSDHKIVHIYFEDCSLRTFIKIVMIKSVMPLLTSWHMYKIFFISVVHVPFSVESGASSHRVMLWRKLSATPWLSWWKIGIKPLATQSCLLAWKCNNEAYIGEGVLFESLVTSSLPCNFCFLQTSLVRGKQQYCACVTLKKR